MTDISTIAPIAVRWSHAQQPTILPLRIAAPLAAMSILLGDALRMAYVDPYASRGRGRQVAPEEGLDGRDPDW